MFIGSLFATVYLILSAPSPGRLPEEVPRQDAARSYVCPPCGCRQDETVHREPGACSACGMQLVEKTASLRRTDAIPYFLRLNDRVWTGGQPTLEQLAALKEEGVRMIINLRNPAEHAAHEEEARARELGIGYYNVPVVYNDPKEEQATEFLRITDGIREGPVLIHCAAAIRVGAFWMIRRVLRDGWTYENALEEANRIGLRNRAHLVEFARRYIEQHKK